ncbi:hypothetical protein HZ996_04160 [Cryomorphaceae bacterium]|nr:hypothetical protein HZ996_04160 [Cryomorphaceae bacterium]
MKVKIENGERVLEVHSAGEWRNWLEQHHDDAGVWLVLFKKSKGPQPLSYNDALNEALCFGWIDSRKRSRDERTYVMFFGPRRPNSHWTKGNTERVLRLRRDGLLRPPGEAAAAHLKNPG